MKSAMTSSPLRVAIIGAGQVADKVHASYYCTRNDLELVAVCDSRLSQAQALAEKYGNASVWDDPQAMLLAVKPDVVSVCSPNRFHLKLLVKKLAALALHATGGQTTLNKTFRKRIHNHHRQCGHQ